MHVASASVPSATCQLKQDPLTCRVTGGTALDLITNRGTMEKATRKKSSDGTVSSPSFGDTWTEAGRRRSVVCQRGVHQIHFSSGASKNPKHRAEYVVSDGENGRAPYGVERCLRGVNPLSNIPRIAAVPFSHALA